MLRLPIITAVRLAFITGILTALPALAVYAPVPEQEQGHALTFTAKAGISHDSNLFGAASRPVGSTIFELAPRVSYNASLTDQTFFAAGYGLTLDEFDNRPGEKLLDSHDALLRLAHEFRKGTTIDLVNSFMYSRNPESLLSGIPLNPDQSFARNQFDGHFVTPVTAKIGAEVKGRSVFYKYRNGTLGRSLDRVENLYGVAANYAVLPEVKAAAELRHLDIFYRKEGEDKNKRSEFAMAGVDYEAAKKLTVSGRVGAEWRHRSAERSATSPTAEISGKYEYLESSFLVAGYGYSIDEVSDTARFTDARTNRFFVNVQHGFSALIVGSASIDFEPAQLQGRRGQPNIDEDTVRGGVALSYLRTKNWLVSISYDYDHVRSDDPGRALDRNRYGLNASYTF